MPRPEIRYEDAAEERTVTGWCCKTCGRYWGNEEHMARYCCSTSRPCECGGRFQTRSYTCCDACRQAKADARWSKLYESAVAWDGETPLCTWDDDRYFFSAEEISDYLEDVDDDDEQRTLESLRLVLCEPDNGHTFEMEDYLADNLPDDDHGGHGLDFREINKAVNDWIKTHSPFSWHATNKAVLIDSIGVIVNQEGA